MKTGRWEISKVHRNQPAVVTVLGAAIGLSAATGAEGVTGAEVSR